MKRTDLMHALKVVQPALGDNDLVQVFTHFMFTPLTIEASSDALAITHRVDGLDIEAPFALHGKTLLGLLDNSNADDVSLALGKTHDCIVKAGRSQFKLPFLTEQDFIFEVPTSSKGHGCTQITVNESFIKGITSCLITASRDEATAAIRGVTVKLDDDALVLYSCDGDAITRYFPETDVNDVFGEWLFPLSFCETLVRTYEALNCKEGHLEISKDWISVALDDTTGIYGRYSENSEGLNHEEKINETMSMDTSFVGVPDDFEGALQRASVLARRESKPTILKVTKGKLNVHTESSMGVADDDMPIKGHGDVKAAVNAELVLRALSLGDEIAILENCTVYKSGDTLLQVLANMGE